MSARAWCITLNCAQESIPTESEWRSYMEQLNATRYVAQVETGESGTPHVQAYCYIAKNTRLSALKKVLPRAHLEPRKGTEQQAWEYCTKESTRSGWRLESGAPISGQGHRSDLSMAIELMRTKGIKRAAEEYPEVYVRNYKGLAALSSALNPATLEYTPELTVTVIWGDPGSGKTRHCLEQADGDVYELTDWPWFDGYTGQKHLLIDDFYGQIPFAKFLRLTDRYRRQWQVKGGFVTQAWTHIWITSNVPSDKWWPGVAEKVHPGQLKRRITKEFYMGEGGAVAPTEFEKELGYA